jgi:transposase
VVIGGVDTHGRTHHAAAIDQQGRRLGDREFPADSGGYRQLLGWRGRHGNPDTVGVEGTGSYGAGLTRYLLDLGVKVVEVDRPDRRTRRQRGKSDPIDAEAAARAVLAGVVTAPAKRRDSRRGVDPGAPGGPQRCHQGPNRSDQLKGLLVTAPASLREALEGRSTAALAAACARWRPDETALADPLDATKAALRVVACRIQQLDEEIGVADQRLATLVGRAAPRLLDAARDRRRPRRAAADNHRPASRAASQRGRLRAPVRGRADPRQLGQDPPAPAPPWR